MSLSFYAKTTTTHAGYLNRLNLPFRYLQQDFPHHSLTLSKADPDREYNGYFSYALSPAKNLPYFARWKEKGTWVWVLDDLHSDLPPWHERKTNEEELGLWAAHRELADLIVVSTPALAEGVGWPEKTLVAPYLIEPSAYRIEGPAPESGKLRVLWCGSDSHLGDLRLIDGAVDRLVKEFGDRVEFLFIGAGPERSLRDHWNRGVRLLEWVPLDQYWNLLSAVKPHLTLAPLVDHPFNRCRSNLRVIEAWAMHSPVVASPVGEYRFLREGVDGLFAETEDQWVDRVSWLLREPELRHSLARAGRERVEREWSWNNPHCRSPWRSVVEEIESRQ